MTYPQGPAQPYDSQVGQAAAQYPPPQPTDTADDFILSALVAAIIAGWALSKVAGILSSAPDTEPEVIRFLLQQQIFIRLLSLADLPATNAPLANQRRQNAFRRAAYVLNATRRLSTAWRTAAPAQSGGKVWPADRLHALGRAWEKEANYLGSHLQATRKRNEAAIQIANAWARLGRPALLGWHAEMDARTTAECRAANGRNFDPRRIPPIGYPGAVHPNCRCRPVRAWNTDLRVENLPDPRLMFDGVVAATSSNWQVATVHNL